MVDAEVEKELQEKMVAKDRSSGQPAKPAEKSEQDLKADRLAEALRENLHKRKEQSQNRDQDDTKDAGGKNEVPWGLGPG